MAGFDPRRDGFDEITRPVVEIYDAMERDLIREIARRFAGEYDDVAGSLAWQIRKLDEMGALNADTVKIIAKYAGKAEPEIWRMLRRAAAQNVDMAFLVHAFETGRLAVDPRIIWDSPAYRNAIENAFVELRDGVFRMINTNAQQGAQQAYMDVINRAYIETGSGVWNYETAIQRALCRMADQGITAATYEQPSGRVIHYDIESCVRRDTLTAVDQMANRNSMQMAEDVGAGYVEVSAHIGARVGPPGTPRDHEGWQGKVYKIDGSAPGYPNLHDVTGYPDDVAGLAGVNCRHRMYPFVPGASVPTEWNIDSAENTKAYKESQHLRYLQRNVRAWKKRVAALQAAELPDDKELKKAKAKVREWQIRAADYADATGQDREAERERIAGEW